jgi:hypothetical protein
MLEIVFHAFVALSADRRIAEQMIACLYALPRMEPLTPLSQTHSGTKWFGKPSPDRSSVGASSLVWPCAGCASKSKSPDGDSWFIKWLNYQQPPPQTAQFPNSHVATPGNAANCKPNSRAVMA